MLESNGGLHLALTDKDMKSCLARGGVDLFAAAGADSGLVLGDDDVGDAVADSIANHFDKVCSSPCTEPDVLASKFGGKILLSLKSAFVDLSSTIALSNSGGFYRPGTQHNEKVQSRALRLYTLATKMFRAVDKACPGKEKRYLAPSCSSRPKSC